ncbi:amidase [Granulicoccus sp. GXG6511]|uniref:amidase n=1 Tax=Granulicoccus sp. GXG6511 TaxID=3381351 RepID=UPI003D7DEA71
MTQESTLDRPLNELAAAVTEGRATAAEVLADARNRIQQGEPRVHAWVALDPGADRSAGEVDAGRRSGPLSGVPVGVKDIIDLAGLPTRCGSDITSAEPVGASAACVELLQSRGAVVVGKTVTTEFAYFKPGPTENPAAPGHTPGGSSSGSAAAVAAGMVPLALGSQTAGSLTRPAAFCGVAGMVLTRGAVDLGGITGLSPSLDSLGLLARSVEDLAYAQEALIGAGAGATGSGHILIWRGSDLDTVAPAMAQAVALAEERLAEDMPGVGQLDWDDHVQTLAADHATIMAYEACRERPELLGRLDELSAPLGELLRTGQRVVNDDYQAALIRRDRSMAELEVLLRDSGVIVGPAALGPAPAGLSVTGSPVLSRPWQLLGLPVVTVPGVRSGDGRPLGLQVIGLPGAEGRVLAQARRLERLIAGTRTESDE